MIPKVMIILGSASDKEITRLKDSLWMQPT